jgi:hypothetical protein
VTRVRFYPVDVEVRCWGPRKERDPDGSLWGNNWAVGVRISTRMRIGSRVVKTRLALRKVAFPQHPTPEEALIEADQIAQAGAALLSEQLGTALDVAPREKWHIDTHEWLDDHEWLAK